MPAVKRGAGMVLYHPAERREKTASEGFTEHTPSAAAVAACDLRRAGFRSSPPPRRGRLMPAEAGA